MIDSTLYHRLSPIARRVQMRRAFLWLALVWAAAGAAGLGLWWLWNCADGEHSARAGSEDGPEVRVRRLQLR